MNAATLPKLPIVILAAGFSSRLGRPKAMARVGSHSLLRRTLELAASLAPAKIIVVLPRAASRYRIEARGFKVIWAVNPHRAEGLSSSVRRGITVARNSPALLLLPVDLAGLRQRDLTRLLARWRASRRCVIARRVGSRGGVPLILPHWLYSQALAVTGDIGLRELINGLPSEQRMLLDLPSAALDVDTPEDLSKARRRR